MGNWQKIKSVLSEEKKLIEVKNWQEIVFIGDTHGDFETSQKIIKNYLRSKTIIVFLGDYVDRGAASRENIEFLLTEKTNHPGQIYLLQGNHEGYPTLPCSPANFWQSLTKEEFKNYKLVFEKLPLSFVAGDLIALHGALPDVAEVKKINQIKPGDRNWWQMTWGDFCQEKGGYLGDDPFTGRPQFGADWFLNLMTRFGKKILIRSHQPNAPLRMFGQRCLTIFTSSAYARERNIAVVEKNKIEVIQI